MSEIGLPAEPRATRRRGIRQPVAALALAGLVGALPAAAQTPAAANSTVRLIELLIQNGVLTRDQAEGLLRQAEAEAAAARPAPRPAPAPPRPAPAPPPAPAVVPLPSAPEVPPGTVRVTFVPETVRRQISEEVRRDVVAELQAQGAAAAQPAAPEWTRRLRPYGDVRLRAEMTNFDDGNASSALFPNFQSINNGSAFDLNGTANAPLLNLSEDRTRYRLRARFGLEARLDDWVTADFRLATGNDSSPVSTNQTFGAVSSSTGQFGTSGKYAIWLDRAYLRLKPLDTLSFDVGRMPNPFASTDLVYDEDLNFDGVMGSFRRPIAQGLTGFLTAGAFPYFNTDLNFSSTEVAKFRSRDRYMLGVQAGTDWRFARDWGLGFSVGYYNFVNAEGSVSSPCAVPYAADACDTDISRSFFTQNTNTFRPIRNQVPNPANPTGPNPQFFGLASRFEVLDINARLAYSGFAPYRVMFEGNYVNNLGFDRSRILGRGVFPAGSPNGIINNLGTGNDFTGGGEGYLLRVSVGHAEVERWPNWQVAFTYRYLESDAVLDAFTDSDFRLGGTNSKGYILSGTLGIARNTALRLRFLSGEEVAGPAYRADVIQLDLTGRF
jgi:hypothetical protein